jgi:hypothetical protein
MDHRVPVSDLEQRLSVGQEPLRRVPDQVESDGVVDGEACVMEVVEVEAGGNRDLASNT